MQKPLQHLGCSPQQPSENAEECIAATREQIACRFALFQNMLDGAVRFG